MELVVSPRRGRHLCHGSSLDSNWQVLLPVEERSTVPRHVNLTDNCQETHERIMPHLMGKFSSVRSVRSCQIQSKKVNGVP
ncbi:hypothetical protein AV530_012741 [Patagioenas fasciata monilis]|uniref:Uncharacterized protein n=1 Tax=Patagioenas fasciata monilis TaxID=372326 RepID=A0A1V4JCE3_PATFA|nr:hypothetical protein AV530_012741 [Patagioenas fasciata monilis]